MLRNKVKLCGSIEFLVVPPLLRVAEHLDRHVTTWRQPASRSFRVDSSIRSMFGQPGMFKGLADLFGWCGSPQRTHAAHFAVVVARSRGFSAAGVTIFV